MDSIYIIELFGKAINDMVEKPYAKISIHRIYQVTQYKWYLGQDGYPFTYINGARIQLHRYVWFLKTSHYSNFHTDLSDNIIRLYVDHINRDKLDATDENLRLATPAQNSYNKTLKNSIQDPITGELLHHIKWKKSGYEVCITKDGHCAKINCIKTLLEAKQIYNLMAEDMFGTFAILYD